MNEEPTVLDLIEAGLNITIRVSELLRDTLIVTYTLQDEQLEEVVLID